MLEIHGSVGARSTGMMIIKWRDRTYTGTASVGLKWTIDENNSQEQPSTTIEENNEKFRSAIAKKRDFLNRQYSMQRLT